MHQSGGALFFVPEARVGVLPSGTFADSDMRNRGAAIAMAMAAAMAGMPGAQMLPAGQTVANAGASQAGEQGQQNRLPGTANFLGALLDGAGAFGSKPFRPTYRKRPHGSVVRDKRDSRKSRNRLRMKGRP